MPDEPERSPIESVLPGAMIHPLPDDEAFHSAFLLIRCIDEDGDPGWAFRTTESLNLEELLGALTVQVEVLKARLVHHWSME